MRRLCRGLGQGSAAERQYASIEADLRNHITDGPGRYDRIGTPIQSRRRGVRPITQTETDYAFAFVGR